jgi:hypothetical protein
MAHPTMTLDQALPMLRRGFILRIHGADEYQGAQLREADGKLEIDKGGNGQWDYPYDVPLLNLTFDVYDQKKVEYVDYTKPIVERDPGAQAVTRELADAKTGAELGVTSNTQVFTEEDEEELELEALRILEENGERSPTDEQVADMVGQLKRKADEVNPVTEQGGGNNPAPPEPDAATPETLGLNEAQVDQVEPPEDDELPDEPTRVAEPR